MPELIVSRHALDRYRERVSDVPDSEAFALLSSRAFQVAAEFGAPFVRLPCGHRALIRGDTVVTVIPCGLPPDKRWQMYDRRCDHG